MLSPWFPVFCAGLLLVYYALPGTLRWTALLAASMVFYCLSGVQGGIFVLITAVSSYAGALLMGALTQRRKAWLKAHRELPREEKQVYKKRSKRAQRTVMILTLVLNFGILGIFKYSGFVFGSSGFMDSLVVPLGISFYTFQTMGYVIDIYWEKYDPERNFFKHLLFVSFFPQMTQGPISDYQFLQAQLFTPHFFAYENFSKGFARMLAGFFKKLVLAGLIGPWVQTVFANYNEYAGISVAIGAVCYSIWIYADFSGYMDIICGYCQMLGITLSENFERPYFSKSVAEYWRRWHITLGAWFKSYLYYPIAVSKWNQRLAKGATKRLGKAFGQSLCASIALVAVWLTTGLWHGASWSYVAWGGVNGLCIIAAIWLEPVFQRMKKGLRIREDAWLWRAFQTLRTFALVTLIKVLPEVGTLSQGLGLWKRIFTNFTLPATIRELLPFAGNKLTVFAVAISTLGLFLSSLLARKEAIRDRFYRLPMAVRIGTLAMLTLAIVYFGGMGSGGGFLYAQF